MKKRVLIVEDDQALAKVLADNLAVEGYEVDHVADGNLALERVLASFQISSCSTSRFRG